jgi:hypothetical protein
MQVYSWSTFPPGVELATFINNRIVDFSISPSYSPGYNSLSIYPIVPGSANPAPLLQCTAKMLQACGYAFDEAVHPSGKYIFSQIDTDTEQIVKIEGKS